MDEPAERDNDAIVALFDEALRIEERAQPPTEAEWSEWLYGRAGFTEPDEHGWTASVSQAEVWVPRALVFWQLALLSDMPVGEEHMCDPRHSLARWPTIEAAVRRKLGMVA